MRVGCPREIKRHEYRVGLTPTSVREYVRSGHQVIVETGAGAGIGENDGTYEAAGARIAATAADVFSSCDMIVKVKEPQESEWSLLRRGQMLFAYLHLAPDPAQTEGLRSSGVTAIAYETVTDEKGALPLLAPMSEVAGRLSIQAAATVLERSKGGRGVLLGGVPGVVPGRVLILGGGVVGTEAARIAAGMGAIVTVLDRSIPRLRELGDLFGGRVETLFSTSATLEQRLAEADAVIGAVLIPGASAPKLVTRVMLANMKRGAVLVDVAIDQGGCFETSHPTTHDKPTFELDGVMHYCVANMPGAVPLTATTALNNATLPFGLALANRGLGALHDDPHLRAGLNVHAGLVTNGAVAQSLGVEHVDVDRALATFE